MTSTKPLLLVLTLCSLAFGQSATRPASRPAAVVTLTEPAAQQVDRIIKEQALDRAHVYLVVGVRAPAAPGQPFTYTLDLNEAAPGPEDITAESRGIRTRVAPDAAAYLQGTTIDFGHRDGKAGFIFHNPNAVEK
jgi:iron-sulfur cluster assembly accessory protein